MWVAIYVNFLLFLQELAHRQQFFFWKNYRNNRLKHILPRTPPEPPTSIAPVPPPSVAAAPTAPAQAASPMQQFSGAPGAAIPKNDPRNSAIRKRK